MSEPTPSPDWSLLPHAPLAFFQLVEDFDRKQLKRSYNRLIRIYKPEKHPAEFQKIRSAFEQLDNQLRYGQNSYQSQPTENYQWQTDVPEQQPVIAGVSNADQAAAAPKTTAIHERIQQESLAAVYQELANKKRKTAYEYYALGVMSDVVIQKDKSYFIRWLLQGIQSHPDEVALLALLYEYLRGPVAMAEVRGLLINCSKLLNERHFFGMTEPLWQRLLREGSFQDFQKLLDECETQLPGREIDGKLTFSVEILKSAIWKADQNWLNHRMAFIEENFERIPEHIHYDLDLLDFLKRYITSRDQGNSQHPLRKKIDAAIQSYFSTEQQDGDRAILEVQLDIAQYAEELQAAFPYESGEDYEPLYIVWSSICEDVAKRHTTPPAKETDLNAWHTRMRPLLGQIDSSSSGHWASTSWTVTKIIYIISLVVFFFFMSIGTTLLFTFSTLTIKSNLTTVFVLLISLTLTSAICLYGYKKLISKYWNQYELKKSVMCYREHWRPVFLEFMQRSHLSFFELRELLLVTNIQGFSNAEWAIAHYQQDYALAFFSHSQQFTV